ncbi:MAG: hypothetical protein ACYC0U_09135, partial [Ilumatobacteraceae bacterium]
SRYELIDVSVIEELLSVGMSTSLGFWLRLIDHTELRALRHGQRVKNFRVVRGAASGLVA